MQCPRCQHANDAAARFCEECGATLGARTCANCSTELKAAAKFCPSCGTPVGHSAEAPLERDPRAYTPKHLADKILQSKSALEGERKQVTVLFADVRGSMALAEQLDAEEWHQILDRFFQILTDGVHRFEGTVNQYTGDGIMALFGAPIAHEDHAQRACYAALALREAIARYATDLKRQHGLGFSTRMGLNSGDVVVGRIGDDLRMDYTAQGQTVGLAQRMEALASPDTCYLTAATAACVTGYFALEDLGEFQVKGVREPVCVHRLIGPGTAQTRFDVSRARGLTRFVGRDTDMARLESALAEAQGGNGQVVGVVAEAGTGKSRLCYEFVERCRAQGMTVLEGHAVAHGRSIPYLAMLQVFRAYYGVTERDDDRAVREKIAGRLLLLDESFRDVLPVMFEFFGAPDPERPVPTMPAEARQRQLFGVLRRLVQNTPQTGARSFVTLIEDLHWLDPGSEAFLAEWVEALAGSAGFLVVNFRPEYHAVWMQKSYYRQLPLAPLGSDATRELLADLLGSHPTTEGLAEAIHARSSGNPFFTEEIVQTLIESEQLAGTRGAYRLVTPITRLEVPASVQAVLAARIDRLEERDKHVLQAAAVIGKEFSEPILMEAAELPMDELRAALAALRTSEFVYERALYPVAEFAFKHPLTQEVALGSQLQERRRRTHAAVARAIERLQAGRLDEQAALLAHHWEEAAEALVAAQWHERAAERVRQSDVFQALTHKQRVLALTDALEASPARDEVRLAACRSLLLVQGWSVGLSQEERARIFADGIVLAERAGDVGQTVDLHVGYALGKGLAGDIPGYYAAAREAAVLADGSVSKGTLSMVYGALCYSAYLSGRLHEALEIIDKLARLAEGDPAIGVETAGFSAWVYTFHARAQTTASIGRLDEAWALVHEGTRLARLHDRFMLCQGATFTAELADWSGTEASEHEANDIRRLNVEALELADEGAGNFLRVETRRGLAIAHFLYGAWRDAAQLLEEAHTRMRREHTGLEREAMLLTYLARAYLGQGDAVRAQTTAETAIARGREQGAHFFQGMAELTLASVLRVRSGVAAADEIEASLGRALALVEKTGGRVIEPQIIEEQARLAALQHDDATVEKLRRAQALYVDIGATGHAKRVAKELRD